MADQRIVKHSAETRAKMAAKARGRVVHPETRAKMRASHLLQPPEEHVQAMIELYAVASMDAVCERIGYHRKVVRRVLTERGITIRPAGFQQGNRLGCADA
jgi:hypothetical protein